MWASNLSERYTIYISQTKGRKTNISVFGIMKMMAIISIKFDKLHGYHMSEREILLHKATTWNHCHYVWYNVLMWAFALKHLRFVSLIEKQDPQNSLFVLQILKNKTCTISTMCWISKSCRLKCSNSNLA